MSEFGAKKILLGKVILSQSVRILGHVNVKFNNKQFIMIYMSFLGGVLMSDNKKTTFVSAIKLSNTVPQLVEAFNLAQRNS